MNIDIIALAAVIFGSDTLLTLILKHIWEKADKKDEIKKRVEEIQEQIANQAHFDSEFNERVADIQRYNVEAAKEREVFKETLRLLSYDMLANRLLHYIEQGYATRTERESVSLYIRNYKQNHWNGDINALLERFNDLPYEEEGHK